MATDGRRLSGIASLALLVFLTLTGCGTTDTVSVQKEKPDVQVSGQQRPLPDQGRPYNIPLEYMPPPGKCRIWFPGRAPEHQPPTGECADLERHVPLNTWLLRGSRE
jgi:hypothetical protein